ncbi:hypothetical protein KP509_08G027500 [Ceratopteris richardii]|uniref:Uncharacterized protein n=1 Tax=Ceratopteris richardii TaxID=49495 RepID=A0A8T2UCR1_CERRI|nr:hypothetical protein KP509_08G027500 [Ceratopteris richardii]
MSIICGGGCSCGSNYNFDSGCKCGKKIFDETSLYAPREVTVSTDACKCGSNGQCGDSCPCEEEGTSSGNTCGANCTCDLALVKDITCCSKALCRNDCVA